MRAFGATDQEVEEILEQRRQAYDQENRLSAVEVYHDNWHAWTLFHHVGDQWVRDGLGAPVALDGNVVLGVVALVERKRSKRIALYESIMAIAQGVIWVMREKQKAEQDRQRIELSKRHPKQPIRHR